MRIALVSGNSFYFPGGVQEHIKDLAKYLKSQGHYVKIIAPRYKKDEKYDKNFILIGRAIPLSVNASMAQISFLDKKSNIDKILSREKFDIIHFHNPSFFIGTQILKKSNSKNILTLHFLPDASLIYKFLKNILNNWVEKGFSDKINGVIAVSKPVVKYVPKKFKCTRKIIPNGIDLKKFETNKKRIKKYDDEKINILFLGRIEKRKGLIYLLKSYKILKKKYPNIRLIVVGSGEKEGKCKKFVKKSKLADVNFVGRVSDKEKIMYYNTADIFCSPAIYGESFGIVLLEAMACGKPIVAYANKGYKEVLKGKAKKFLAKPKDVNELAKKLEILIKNEELRREMGEFGKKEVKKYSWQIVGGQIEDFYKKVLHHGKDK